MPFVNSSALNNLQVDGAYVYVQSPTPVAGQGIPTSLSGIVGTAGWGPLDTPVAFSNTSSLYAAFGSYASCGQDQFSLVTEGQFAVAYSNNFLGVRRSDGTDTAATVLLKDSGNTNGVSLTAKYTGTEGNNISVVFQTGSNSVVSAPTLTAVVTRLGYAPEVFTNLSNPTGGGFAAALIAAINTGIPGQRGASQLVVATAQGTSVANFVASTSPVSLAGGTNGKAPTSSQLIGTDGAAGARTGVYALRGTGIQQFIVAGLSDSTQFAAEATFATSEGSLAICALPSGTSVATAVATKQTANFNSINGVLLKDWVKFTDPATGTNRLVSPLGVALGVISSLSPEQSPGNKPVNGIFNITGTENTGNPYAQADDQMLEQAGIMYIRQGIERNSSLYGFWNGQNASPNWNSGTDTVAYTRMTNFLGQSVMGLLGPYVHELQSSSPNDQTRANAKNALVSFLQSLQSQGRIAAYNVQLDNVINTQTTIAQGICLALVQVQYMSVIKFFLCTLQGGGNVQLSQGIVSTV